ncbi:MAG: HTH-type transcriptional regulator MalT [Actinomycetota bacterium]|nr:HTH-type transcriptional regulator MalT [Actinomycetota bacterium]
MFEERRVGAAILPQALVTTKLRAPRTRPNLVDRPRLREVLARNEVCPLTLVSAPAGFGKTTLLGDWSEQLSRDGKSVAWVSLDLSDNDPARFLTYLVGALQEIEEGIGEGVLASLRSPQMPPIEALMGVLVNELAEVAHEITVILDDYHLIDSDPVHEAVSFLLEHLPENARLVISSRADPPLPLARLRVRDQMTEVRAADLRFTPEEASAFLNDVMGLSLSEGDVAVLEGVTEGWIAALQLAALSMRDRQDTSGFVESFSGSNRHVLDFLAEEVLERQPEGVREFLLKTSVLERMSASLCDSLTSRNDGQQMLERLEHENLFVIALDDERQWYRYHHLFADVLRSRLQREQPERIRELHRRAAAWYERNGWTSEAIRHALAAQDHDRAADLVEDVARKMWFRGEVMTLLGWLEALPEETRRRRPQLLLQYSATLLWVGQLDDVEPLVQEIERAVGPSGEGRDEDLQSSADETLRQVLLGGVAATRSWRAYLKGEPHDAIALARRALELLPETDLELRTYAAFRLAEGYRTADDLEAATAAYAETAELGRAAGHDFLVLKAMSRQAKLQMVQGRLRKADHVLRHALRFADERGGDSLPATGEVKVVLGELLYEWDELEAAARRLKEGIRLSERMAQLDTLVDGYVALSRLEMVQGNTESALESAQEANSLAQRSGAAEAIVEAAAWNARLHLTRGDLTAAVLELERIAGTSAVSVSMVRESGQITRARLTMVRGEHDEALQLLEGLREAAEASDRKGNLLEILVLQALALWATNEKERAVTTLTRALVLAEPEGYVRTFADEGAAMGDLLSEVLDAQQRGRLDATPSVPMRYLAKLLAALAREDAAPAADERLPEPLSERELEVLALVAAGMSNKEIAGRLFVSVTTVKTHINNLYRKLDARSRIQAVARARELGLI